jgi:hypothetical protein
MVTEEGKKPGNPISTEGIPSVYANVASISMSLHDLRIYFAEVSPKEVVTQPLPDAQAKSVEGNIVPRLCIITAPEFARSLRDALIDGIKRYENQFGQLRANPDTK